MPSVAATQPQPLRTSANQTAYSAYSLLRASHALESLDVAPDLEKHEMRA